jgi:bifunctional non-homologous end joining protein LigD
MKEARTESEIRVGTKTLKVSNVGKVFYPKVGFTKGQVIDYYIRISKWLLPHLKDRPLTLKRYPNGVEGEFFYEKRCPTFRPNWLKTATVWSEGNQANIDFCLANDLPSLVWAANLGDLELHTSLSKKQNPLKPTMMVFDLDPGPPADILNCTRVAFWLRGIFDHLGLQSFAKTTGSKGLQVYVPLNTAVSYDETKVFAKTLAQLLTREHPNEVVYDMKKALRVGKVLVDWSQNDDHKTTVCVYSLRAKERPTVSTPVTWDELEKVQRSGKPEQLTFDSEAVVKRAEKLGDLFAPVLTLKQKLPKLQQAERLVPA